MNPVQTYDPYDGRMIAREERIGGYVLLSDYQKLEKRVRELEKTPILTGARTGKSIAPETNRDALNARGTYANQTE
jgi:hypothetical protein